MTEEAPIPVLGTDGLVGLDYAVQITDLGIDFAPPSDEEAVKEQQYAAHASVCAGLGCPTDDAFDNALTAIEAFRAHVASPVRRSPRLTIGSAVPFDPSERTRADIESEVSSLTNPMELRALLLAERRGENRKTVVRTLRRRIRNTSRLMR